MPQSLGPQYVPPEHEPAAADLLQHVLHWLEGRGWGPSLFGPHNARQALDAAQGLLDALGVRESTPEEREELP